MRRKSLTQLLAQHLFPPRCPARPPLQSCQLCPIPPCPALWLGAAPQPCLPMPRLGSPTPLCSAPGAAAAWPAGPCCRLQPPTVCSLAVGRFPEPPTPLLARWHSCSGVLLASTPAAAQASCVWACGFPAGSRLQLPHREAQVPSAPRVVLQAAPRTHRLRIPPP